MSIDELVYRRVFRAPRELVWRCLTEPAELAPGQRGDQRAGDGRGERQRSVTETRSAAGTRAAQKELARLERQLDKAERREGELHAAMAAHADDYEKLIELETELTGIRKEKGELEESWLHAADRM